MYARPQNNPAYHMCWHCSINNTWTNKFQVQIFSPNNTDHISRIPGEWSLVVEAAALFGDETAGLLASWSFCSSFFVPIYSLKNKKKQKESKLITTGTATQAVCGKGCLTKGKQSKVLFRWFAAMARPPVLQGRHTEREFSWRGQGTKHTAASDLMGKSLSWEVAAPQWPWRTMWELILSCP